MPKQLSVQAGKKIFARFDNSSFERLPGSIHPKLFALVGSIDLPNPPPLEALNWATKPGVTSPAKNQLPYNTCTSFAICAALEARHAIATHGQVIALLPGFIHTCLAYGLTYYQGFNPTVAVQKIRQYGIAFASDNTSPIHLAGAQSRRDIR